jgi:hypothetical protein
MSLGSRDKKQALNCCSVFLEDFCDVLETELVKQVAIQMVTPSQE